MERSLKKIRQAAKNRKSAGESRQRKLGYLKELRKTKEHLKKELDCIKSLSKRLEVYYILYLSDILAQYN
jgi:hypothetical protein